MDIRALMVIVAGPAFLVSIAMYVYVQLRLKPDNNELDDYYWEVEDRHPGLANYNKWSRVTFGIAVVAALILFAATFI